MTELYTGRRGLAVTVINSEVAADCYQEELMAAGIGWFRVCHADGAITLAPTGMMPLTFETEGNVELKALRLSHKRGESWTPDGLEPFVPADEISKLPN
jgi:hypothetical protein